MIDTIEWHQRMTVFDKAQEDPFAYVCKLRTGETVKFEQMTALMDGWVRLHIIDPSENYGFAERYTFARGLEVRAADIVWIADAGGYDS